METGSNIEKLQRENHTFSFVDSSFEEKKSSHSYHLSIEISSDKLSFAILDVIQNKYIFWRGKPCNCEDKKALKNTIENQLELKLDYRSVSVSYAGFNSTLVPNSFYIEEKKKDIIAFNFPLSEEDIIVDKLLNIECRNIYTIPTQISSWGRNFFSQPIEIHNNTILIEKLVVLSKSVEKYCVQANIRLSEFDLCIVRNGELLFCNNFKKQQPEDVAYFLLYTLEQLKIRNYEIELLFSGNVEKNDSLTELLAAYIKKIEFIENTTELKLSNSFSMPYHVGFTIFNQYLCV